MRVASKQMTHVEAPCVLAIDASRDMVTAKIRAPYSIPKVSTVYESASYLDSKAMLCLKSFLVPPRDLYQIFLALPTNQLRRSVERRIQALKSKVLVLINWNLAETFALRNSERSVLQVIINVALLCQDDGFRTYVPELIQHIQHVITEQRLSGLCYQKVPAYDSS